LPDVRRKHTLIKQYKQETELMLLMHTHKIVSKIYLFFNCCRQIQKSGQRFHNFTRQWITL